MSETAQSRSWRRFWPLIPVLILLAGVGLSVGLALVRHSTLQAQEHENFRATSSDVTATIAEGLRSDTDFIRMLRALVAMQPHMSATQFDRWYKELEGTRSQVGGLVTAVVSVVAASQLQAFQAQRLSDPAFRRLAGGDGRILPAGRRARYCLLSAIVSRLPESPLIQLATHADWCAPKGAIPGTAQSLRTQADDGQISISPPMLGTSYIGTAVYRPGAPLRTAAERRAAAVAWIWSSLDVPGLLHAALAAHPGFTVAIYHRDPVYGMQLIGSAGAAPPEDALSYGSQLEPGGAWAASGGAWAVRLRGKPSLKGVSATGQELLVGGAGMLITALLVALASMLLRSRDRALGLADQRTGELRHQALHDALTGLPNRMLALDRAAHMIAQAQRRHTMVAALCVDLDGFGYVNDAYGQAAGDRLLQVAGARLSSVAGQADTVARLGGDEFVILLEQSSLQAGPELMAERLLEVLRLPYRIENGHTRTLSVTASIGIAHGLYDSAEELLRCAGVALGEAKTWGHNRCMVFESSMPTARDRLALKADLADALGRGELSLMYQPIFDLRSERLVGVEALLRWRHPTRGLIRPDEFIPVAEDSGLIEPIGRWVLAQACRQGAAWHARGHPIGVSVNVSARQLDSEALVGHVADALRESGLDSQALTLEVTETVIMRDAQANARRLQRLKQLGVRIAVDDFGTGHSSLAYLRQFPVDVLKIDRSFITGIAQSHESAAMIHILVQLGKTLGLDTLAEGIEDRAQLEVLLREGCDYGQGFLWMRPLAGEALGDLLDGDSPEGEPPLELGLDRQL
jgi:diguanylate cyclase (GGDEF)-like protein